MKGFRFTIKQKILFGFILIVLLILGNGIYTVVTVIDVDDKISQSVEYTDPLDEVVGEFMNMVTESKMLSTNWVYLQSNKDDQDALKDLHDNGYKGLKTKISDLLAENEDTSRIQYFDTLFFQFEEILDVEKNIMDELREFEDYEDPLKKFFSEDLVSSEIIPRSANLIQSLDSLRTTTQAAKEIDQNENMERLNNLKLWVILLSTAITIISLVIGLLISGTITRPLRRLREVVDRIGIGDLVMDDKAKLSNDELGDMSPRQCTRLVF